MVPAIAFADEAAEATTDEGIDLLSVTPAQAFAQGKLTKALDKMNGASVADPMKAQFVAGSGTYLYPQEVTPSVGTAVVDVTAVDEQDAALFSFAYYGAKADGTIDTSKVFTDSKDALAVGDYYLRITGNNNAGDYKDAELDIPFSVVGASLKDAKIFNTTKDDLTNSEFVYNAEGQAASIGVQLNGTELTAGNGNDYTITFFTADGTSTPVANPTNAGDYIARVAGEGDYANQVVTIPFTINVFDVASANITIPDTTASSLNDVAGVKDSMVVEGETISADLAAKLNLALASGSIYDAAGNYKVTVSAASSTDKNIKGSKQVSFNKVGAIATFKYDNGEITDNPHTFTGATVADKSSLLDVAKISVLKGSTELEEDEYSITVTDADGNAATVADLAKAGDWRVIVQVDSAATDYAVGGTQTINVKVGAGTIAANASLYFTYDGAVVSGTLDTPEYDGSNFMDAIQVVLKSGNKVLTEGSDYNVKIHEDSATGKEVDKIVDAGTYVIVVSSDIYEISGQTTDKQLTVVVNPLTLDATDIAFDGTSKYSYFEEDPNTGDLVRKQKEFYPYTGKAITPSFKFTTDDKTWMPLPADYYEMSFTKDGKPVSEMVEEGTYEVTLTGANDNYSITFTKEIEVANKKVFADVASGAWYYNSVYDAYNLGYMGGYAGSNIFGAEKNITRADAVCVLYNMAGGYTRDYNDPDVQYTSFSDVDPSAYYARAVAWAKGLGIANGFEGKFNPEASITRQDFACLLANYDKVLGEYVAPKDIAATLATYPDGSQTADYAKESVAWACDNGIMGNGDMLAPLSSIIRAEVAAMAVNYQPDGKLQA